MAIMMLYQLWLARNEARDEEAIDDPAIVARRSLFLVEKWLDVRANGLSKPLTKKEHWFPPEVGWFKANADGAFVSASGHGGVAWFFGITMVILWLQIAVFIPCPRC